ncbi:MAG: patatin-like phospholipase family protein [Deltaproteobacteria bacterium]|nr:patatin-like phospholipase family protein [Deltaproteobacteria bacterium]
MAGSSKIGVVFSSGFFGFFAHAGFLTAIRQLGIAPSGYAGASSGAILAAMAASEMTDEAIKGLLFNLQKTDFWDPDPWSKIISSGLRLFRGYSGYLRGAGFERLLEQMPVKRIEDCAVPLLIVATNLTHQKEECFTEGSLVKSVQASGAVPALFQPVQINGALYVDGGMVNKAPVQALADLVEPDRIIVHFIASDNLEEEDNRFLKKRITPWHIHQLSVNISRQEAYKRQCDMLREQGVEVIEVRTSTPSLGPNSLEKGPAVHAKAREATLFALSKKGF